MRKKFGFKIFLLILAFLVGVIGYWNLQKNIFSKEVLKLEILGPEEVSLAEEIEYIVKYKNNGDIRLEEPKLIFDYPEYSIVEGGVLRKEISLEDIYPGEEKSFSFKVRLFGREGEAKVAKANLSYRPKNLKARFESATTFTTIIKSVPLTFEFDLPSKIEPEREIRLALNYYSNTNYPLSDLRCTIEYPSDFEFRESRPAALEQTEWDLGILNRAEGGRIEIRGYLRGAIGEEKIFRAKIGMWQEGKFVLLKEAIQGIEIVKPSLYISQQINRNPQYIASPGDILHYEIFFRNIGQNPLTNLAMIIKLEGTAFDFHSIKAPSGEFKRGDNSIVFEGKKIPELQFLDVLKEGKIDFWINLKEEWEIRGSQDKNPIIKNIVYLSQVREEFVTKVNSELTIEQKGYFEDEIFGNSGPIPPRVGAITTYTIVWQVKNYYNDVKNVKVKAILPPEAQLIPGKIFPAEESSKFAFDSQSREIVWEIGDLPAGTGILTPIKTLAFQIALFPKNLEKTPEIIGQAQVTGQDQFTGETLQNIAPAIDALLAVLSIEMRE